MHILIAEDKYVPPAPATAPPSTTKFTVTVLTKTSDVNQKLFRLILKKLDPSITISVAWNGGEALDYLSNPSPACPRPDIILMDVGFSFSFCASTDMLTPFYHHDQHQVK